MIKARRSTVKASRPLHDFQVFKGGCEKTMEAFGSPVMAHHEAQLLLRDDQAAQAPGAPVVYAIYKRSSNRILQIVTTSGTAANQKTATVPLPFPLAA